LLTIDGLRRRGFRAQAINSFCEALGVTRNENSIPWHVLEHHVRNDLEPIAKRAYCVVDPIKVTIVNFQGEPVVKNVPNHPHDASQGSRQVHFTRTVYIERSDFRTEDHKKYYGLAPGKEVHLKYSYNIKCLSYTLNNDGSVKEIKASYDPENKTKCKGKIHWVSAEPDKHVPVEVRLYNFLFSVPEPGKREGVDWKTEVNPDSEVVKQGFADPSVANTAIGTHLQFERMGFYIADLDSTPDHLVFNRACALKMNAKNKAATGRS
jgi:glutaminyl-tRNA synthetase